MTSYHALGDVSSGDDSAVVLPPPMVCIPGGSSLRESGPSPFDAVSTPTTSVAEKRPMEEKIGRWTEEEHEIFLEGLQLHGKQWKTIATMIGTRTVVQVRTHAQKYFQKLERKNRDSNAIAVQGKKPSKRKSLPSAMPSRKKKLPKKTFPRSVSLSLPPLVPPVMPNPLSGSMQSMSSENLSTNSPVGVMDIEPNPLTFGNGGTFKEEQLLMEIPQGFAEDPLEWLLDGDIQNQLPESSMEHAPMFPDFNGAEPATLSLQAQSGAFDASLLEPIADPKVTVQSLFLDDVHEVA